MSQIYADLFRLLLLNSIRNDKSLQEHLVLHRAMHNREWIVSRATILQSRMGNGDCIVIAGKLHIIRKYRQIFSNCMYEHREEI